MPELNAYLKLSLAGAACVAAFLVGRGCTPAPTVQEKIVYQDREVIKTVVVEKKVEVKGETRVVTRDRVVYANGETREHEVERTETKTKTETKTDKTDEVSVEKTISKVEERAFDSRPRWHASLLAGADLAPAWQPIAGAGPLTLGAHVEYRPVGPLWVGAWVLHTGAAGVSMGIEF